MHLGQTVKNTMKRQSAGEKVLPARLKFHQTFPFGHRRITTIVSRSPNQAIIISPWGIVDKPIPYQFWAWDTHLTLPPRLKSMSSLKAKLRLPHPSSFTRRPSGGPIPQNPSPSGQRMPEG